MEILEVKKMWNAVKDEIIKSVPATSHPWILPLEAVGFENGIFSVLTGNPLSINPIPRLLFGFFNLSFVTICSGSLR